MELPAKHSRCTSGGRAAIFVFGIRINTIKYAYLSVLAYVYRGGLFQHGEPEVFSTGNLSSARLSFFSLFRCGGVLK